MFARLRHVFILTPGEGSNRALQASPSSAADQATRLPVARREKSTLPYLNTVAGNIDI